MVNSGQSIVSRYADLQHMGARHIWGIIN